MSTQAITRKERAQSENMTFLVLDENRYGIVGDSGNAHLLDVDGMRSLDCSCPDRQNRNVKCKHMIAHDEWLIDEVHTSSGMEVEL